MSRHLPSCALLILAMVCPWSAQAQDSGQGQVIPAERGIRSFEPEWDPEDFDLASYLDSLHPDGVRWYQHVQTLANPWMGGRQPGTEGDELAARYIAWNLDQAGLEPAFVDAHGEASWRQPFSFSIGGGTPEVHSAGLQTPDTVFARAEAFDVLGNSGSGDVSLGLSFAGYGVDEGPHGYSSFRDGDDLTDRVVMLLRYEPLDDYGKSRWSSGGFSPHATIRRKVGSLIDRHAAAVLLVNPVGSTDGRTGLESPESSSGFRPHVDIPVLHLTAGTAQALLDHASNGTVTLEELQSEADRGLMGVRHFADDRPVTCSVAVSEPAFDTRNVAGVLPGQGELAPEWVVVGGHYDHIGHGYVGSRSGSDELHPGADDNASGIATVLLLADRAADDARTDEAPRRSILFIGFSGEEAGLHGSTYFVENPSIDLDRTSLMLNFDMVGRARDDAIAVMGTGTAEEFDEVLPTLVGPTGLTVHATPSGRGPSDHSNFYGKDIPVLFLHTGSHADYHTPEDLASRVNPEGSIAILDLGEALLNEATHRTERFTFTESTSGGAPRRTGASVRLGIMPSYSNTDLPGVLIDDVTENTSAAEAGLRKGDVITAWDGEVIEGGRDLMERLRAHKPGDTVSLTISREDESMEIPVTLRGRAE